MRPCGTPTTPSRRSSWLLALPLLFPDWPQYEGKATAGRALTYGRELVYGTFEKGIRRRPLEVRADGRFTIPVDDDCPVRLKVTALGAAGNASRTLRFTIR